MTSETSEPVDAVSKGSQPNVGKVTKISIPVEKDPNILVAAKDKRKNIELDVTPSKSFNKETVLFLIYLLYSSNMITRLHVKQFLKIIQDGPPNDLAKYLVEVAAKA